MSKYYRFLALAIMALSYFLSFNTVNATNQTHLKKILAVDDTSFDLKFKVARINAALKNTSFTPEIVQATNAQDAIEKLSQGPYDLILTDGNMGGGDKDGSALVHHLRDQGNPVPIILETANYNEWHEKLGQISNLTVIDKSNGKQVIAKIKENLGIK